MPPGHSGHEAHHTACRGQPGNAGHTFPRWPSALRTCLRTTREGKGREAHPCPTCSSSSLCSWPHFFKPLEATSLWPAHALGLVSIGSLCLPGRTHAPSRAAEAPAITPTLRGARNGPPPGRAAVQELVTLSNLRKDVRIQTAGRPGSAPSRLLRDTRSFGGVVAGRRQGPPTPGQGSLATLLGGDGSAGLQGS